MAVELSKRRLAQRSECVLFSYILTPVSSHYHKLGSGSPVARTLSVIGLFCLLVSGTLTAILKADAALNAPIAPSSVPVSDWLLRKTMLNSLKSNTPTKHEPEWVKRGPRFRCSERLRHMQGGPRARGPPQDCLKMQQL